jgi:hypothetical protein
MMNLRERLRGTPIHRAWRYAASATGSVRLRNDLDRVRTYCLFIGHARSGHSIVGALLDAHPEMLISDELDALEYLAAGFSRRQLLYLSLAVSRHQAQRQRRKTGRGGAVYSYFVPGQWQGRYQRLRVVGDSRAGWTTRRLSEKPALLSRLERRMGGMQLRFIHVLRNPYDNIATLMIRDQRSFETAFARYFENCEAIAPLSSRIGTDRILRLRHEEVIHHPREALTRACAFLGVSPDAAYLEACSAILYGSPSRSREHVSWSDTEIERVRERIDQFPFLSGYAFDE